MLEDTLLKIRFNKGDKEALCRIYERYKDYLFKIAVALLNDNNLAEDALSETFLNLTRSSGKLRLTGSLKNFLATCTANSARNIYHQRKRKAALGLDDLSQTAAQTAHPTQILIFAEQYQLLQAALDQLDFDQRQTVILRCCNDLKFRQIAQMQSVSTNTAKSRYRYAITKLRTILDSELKNE